MTPREALEQIRRLAGRSANFRSLLRECADTLESSITAVKCGCAERAVAWFDNEFRDNQWTPHSDALRAAIMDGESEPEAKEPVLFTASWAQTLCSLEERVAAAEARERELRNVLIGIRLCSHNPTSSKEECGEIAQRALDREVG